ncbi:NADP-dependent oxidoreductase [Crossiella sp. CA198]|uniref:NADP-dependent oxidoreductase n=1 Tax=Crossiella sp. CA198 TaxID=3455607 RepID=UPI003F8D059C
MRAAAATRFGGIEVLDVVEIPLPEPGPGQVRVRVRAAGIQPFDLAVRAGWTPPYGSVNFPQPLGNEFAGVIDAVGEQVTGIEPGAEVLGFSVLNAQAEYVVVPADAVTPKPPEMPWEVAGGFTAGTQTATLALDQLGIKPGDTVLVHAAAGSVGTAAVQLAQLRGARVIGTAGAANQDYLRSLGATPVIYGETLAAQLKELAPDGVDAVLDGAGGAALELSLTLVANPKQIVTLVEHGKAADLGVQLVNGTRSADRLGTLAKLYAEGKLQFPVRRAYPMHQIQDAHREVETGHGRGKVVLTLD